MLEDGAQKVSVIIPALNNFPAISRTLELVRAAFDPEYELETILVVSDDVPGPVVSDGRVYAVERDARVVVKRLKSDKAVAVHWGISQATGDFIGFIDADACWEAEAEHLRTAVAVLVEGKADCVVAQRDQQHWSGLRRAKTNLFAVIARHLFGLPLRDTQAPMKFMNRDSADLVLSHCVWPGWAFDIDILWVLKTASKSIRPLPVQWKSNGGEMGWVTILLLFTMAPGMLVRTFSLRLTAWRRKKAIKVDVRRRNVGVSSPA
jgi:dolichyl-phosphate beta-glucosyltransferase